MKIQSLYFDAEEGVLEINHNPAGFPVIIEWLDILKEDAFKRRMMVSQLQDEEVYRRAMEGDKLPVIVLSFKDGTGSYKVNNKEVIHGCR